MTGPVKVVLYASSDAVDTDFVAKLVDVHPDGKSYNMAEGIVRARYRDSLSAPSLMKPGRVLDSRLTWWARPSPSRRGIGSGST